MRKPKIDKSILATSLLTLALVSVPKAAQAEQAEGNADTQAIAQTQTAQEAGAQDEQASAETETLAQTAEPTSPAIVEGAQENAKGTAPAKADEPTKDAQPGEAQPSPATTEQTTTATAQAASAPVAQNGIPHITIYVDESDDAIADARVSDTKHSYGTLDELHESSDHSVRCIGNAQIVVPEGFVGEYGSATAPTGAIQLKYIRGRGNSTWTNGEGGKRAYKLEFQKKQDFFGMGKSKEWGLIANAMDPTLLKNRIIYWLGGEMGIAYTPQLVPVDVTMVRTKDGRELASTPLGSYYLSELVQIDKNRLAIDELDEDADADITGGYLLAMYLKEQNGDEPKSTVFTTDSGITFINKDPGYETEDLTPAQRAQRDYIRAYVGDIDQLLMKADAIDDATHTAIDALLDLRSTADYWWLQEFTRNADGFQTSSTYLYKARGGKLCWGPLWDFDTALSSSQYSPLEGFNNTCMPWIDALREKDPRFVALLKERWNDPVSGLNAKLVELTRPGGKLDAYRDEVRASWNANRALWGKNSSSCSYEKSLEERIEELRADIETRRTWINEHFDEIDRAHNTVSFVADDQQVAQENVRVGRPIWPLPEAPEREGYIFTGWRNEATGEIAGEYLMPTQDSVYVADYVSEDEVEQPTELFFRKGQVKADLAIGMMPANQIRPFPFEAPMGKITYTSSDESVATVDNKGRLTLLKQGTATITATLKNGTSGSYQLQVLDNATMVKPTAIDMDGQLTVDAGKVTQVRCDLLPGDGLPMYDFMHFLSDDPTVADVDEYGIVTGLKPGTTTIRVRVDDPMGNESIEAECTVTVTGETGGQRGLGATRGEKQGLGAGTEQVPGADAEQGAKAGAKETGDKAADAKQAKATTSQTADAAKSGKAHKQAASKQAAKQAAKQNATKAAAEQDTTKTAAKQASARQNLGEALPKTGDATNPLQYVLFALMSLVAILSGIVVRKRS